MTGREEHAKGREAVASGQGPGASSADYGSVAVRQKVGGSQETGRRPLLLQRHFEVKIVLAGFRFLDPFQINARVRRIRRFEIEESVHGFPYRNQASVKALCPRSPGYSAVPCCFSAAAETAEGLGTCQLAFLLHRIRPRRLGGMASRPRLSPPINFASQVKPQGLPGIVLQHHQHRQDSVLVRVRPFRTPPRPAPPRCTEWPQS